MIAEDSEIFAQALTDILAVVDDFDVVEVVDNGEDAVSRCIALEPDIVLMDLQMPRLDGLSATERIMAQAPTPILVVTSDPFRGGVDLSFKALSAGALDLMAKPDIVPSARASREALVRKVRLLAQIPVIRHMRARPRPALEEPTLVPGLAEASESAGHDASPLIGIVASTGGPKALAKLLGGLDADFGAGILVVQHITRGFTEHLARWLDANSALTVREARTGDEPEPGLVLLAPGDRHMALTDRGRVRLRRGDSSAGHCPSGDVLLESMARCAGERSVGIILSGMGSDGASGLRALHDIGAPTMVQDEASSVVWGMPGVAVEREAVREIVELDAMATQLELLVERMTRGSR